MFHAESDILNEVPTETDLARALLYEGKLVEARHAISDAIVLSSSSTDPNLKLPIAIQDARIQAAELVAHAGAKSRVDFTGPRRKLQSVRSVSHSLGYYGIECDSRLALAELELRENSPSARAHLAQLAKEARTHGLNRVAREATSLADSATTSSSHLVSQLR